MNEMAHSYHILFLCNGKSNYLDLYFPALPFEPIFFLYTHLDQISYRPLGNATKSKVSFFIIEAISSSMSNIHDSLFYIWIVSFIVIGSLSLVDK